MIKRFLSLVGYFSSGMLLARYQVTQNYLWLVPMVVLLPMALTCSYALVNDEQRKRRR